MVVKGRQEVRDRCLANAERIPDLSKRFKKKTTPYVSIMVVVDPNLGTPLGATFITTGMLWDGTPLLQSLLDEEFHKGELADIAVRIQLHSDSVVWMEGASNAPNFTKWLDLLPAATISFHKAIADKENPGKLKVEKIQAEVSLYIETYSSSFCLNFQVVARTKLNDYLRDISVRAVMQPDTANSARISLQFVPLGLADLGALAAKWQVDVSDPHFPASLVPRNMNSSSYTGPAALMPQELEEDRLGMAWLPFVQIQGGKPRGQLELNWPLIFRNANTLVRRCRLFHRLNYPALPDHLKAESPIALTSWPFINFIWPEYVLPAGTVPAPPTGTSVTVSNNPRYAFTPLPSDTTKYSFVGSFNPRVLSELHGIPEDEAELLSNFANASLARNTWKQYSSALRGFLKFHEAADIVPSFPPLTSTMLRFVAYCLRKRLKSATIRSYISGIKKMCLTITGTLPELLSPYLNAVLLGAQKLDGRVGQKVAVDTNILNSIYLGLRHQKGSKFMKTMVWAVSLLLYWSSCRGGEVLGLHRNDYDPLTTLLFRNVEISSFTDQYNTVEIIRLTLESPKESRTNNPVRVEVFSLPDSHLCPIKAYKKFLKLVPSEEQISDLPVFRWQSGEVFTRQDFNKSLRKTLEPSVDYSGGRLTAHSFRAGRAAAMAAAGFSEEEIKSVGRWRSDSFLHYVKLRAHNLKQTHRLHVQMLTFLNLQPAM